MIIDSRDRLAIPVCIVDGPQLERDEAALERPGVTITESAGIAAEQCQVGVDGAGVRAWPAGR